MNKLKKLLIIPVLLAFSAPSAFAVNAYDMVIVQRDATNSFNGTSFLPVPGSGLSAIVGVDGSTNLRALMTLGSRLNFSGGILSVDTTNIPMSDITDLETTITDLSDSVDAKQDANPYLDELIAIGGPAGANKVLHTNGSGDIVADTTNDFLSWIGGTTVGKAVLQAVDAAAARSAIGAFATPTGTASQYVRGDGSLATFPSVGSGTVTSVAAGTGLSGGTITTTGTISMPNVGTPGTYSGVTTDAQGRVTAGTTISINDAPGRSLVTTTSSTGFQPSATRNVQACYEGVISTTSTIGGPASATVFLEIADTNSTTPGDWTTIAQQSGGQTITLALALQSVDTEAWSFCRVIPAGKYSRIRYTTSGTASVTLNTNQQETAL